MMKALKRNFGLNLATLLAILLTGIACSQTPSLVWLLPFDGAPDDPMHGGNWSRAQHVTPDGLLVVGQAYFGGLESMFNASTWIANYGTSYVAPSSNLGTLEICDPPANNWSWAFGISANGSIVVGVSGCPEAWVVHNAFRWVGGSMQNLGTLGGELSWAYDVSADGAVVVGWADNNEGVMRAFRWEEACGRMQDLGTLGGRRSIAYAVSADGHWISGCAETPDGEVHAVRWYADCSGVYLVQDLGTLGGNYSCAYGISENGTIVVGESKTAEGTIHAFRWTSTDGMQDLGILPGGSYSRAYDVSADGFIVVGEASNSDRRLHAFRWTPARGMEDLNQTYAHLLPGDPISHLAAGAAITPNGRYIVGWGFNLVLTRGAMREMGYTLDTVCPLEPFGDIDCDGCVSDADLIAVLMAWGCCGRCGSADINQDGCVDDADLLIVLINLGRGC